ncbi:MAG: DinB family protein [Anaerolineae bacterium]|jgi:uncharacterized damage-inducible protein DinB|nr:DinB family protein [Anaerolineae bacterium]
MLKLLEDYLERLDGLHAEISRAIDGLPQAALDWVPVHDMNSLGVLVVHITGAERYWIGDVAGRDPSGRDRDAEFETSGVDGATLKRRLDDMSAYVRGVLDRLALSELEAVRISPRDGREFTVAWCLAHALEHTAIHLGHIQIVRQLWDQRQRDRR